MRKITTFLIVLLIQIAIIYVVYRCYYGTSPGKPAPSSAPGTQKPEIANSGTLPAPAPEPGKKTESQRPTPKISSSLGTPLDYKNSIMGNLVSLPLTKDVRTGMLVDIDSREVLWAKQPHTPAPIASMTKMMTLLLVMEELESNPKFTMDTPIKVTRECYRIGGSQVYLDPREEFPVRELLKSVMLRSANDSSYLLSQYLGGGDVENFIAKMNKHAKEIGMNNTSFSNPDGLPEKNPSDENKAAPEDLVLLAERLLQYPMILEYSTMKKAYFREGTPKAMLLTNTNHLILQGVSGVNGMKTGYTVKAGFCITVTCERNGKRLIAVVTGLKSSKDRDNLVKQLLNWGYKKEAGLSVDEKIDTETQTTHSKVKSAKKRTVKKKASA